MAMRAIRAHAGVALVMLNDLIGDTPRRQREEQRLAGLQRMLLHRWGVPMRTREQLIAELEDAGLVVVRSAPTPISQFAFTRGFVLAQRPPSSTSTRTSG